MLERWMPYGTFEATNPVFRFGVRRLRWGSAPATLRRRTRTVALILSGIVLGLWLLVMGGEYVGRSCATMEPSYCYYPLSSASGQFAAVLALLSIGCDVLLDFACILAGYNTMRMGSESAHWDLLRLTPMHLETIVRAQHAVAQTRSWLMTVVVTTLRVDVAVLFLITTFGLPLVFRGGLGDLIGYGYDFQWLFTLATVVIFGSVFIIEPLWRMRAMSALGVALAARFQDATRGTLAALFGVLALWLLAMVIMGFMLWVTVWVGGSLSWYFAPVFGSGLGALVIWGFYRNLADRSLRRGVRYATPR